MDSSTRLFFIGRLKHFACLRMHRAFSDLFRPFQAFSGLFGLFRAFPVSKSSHTPAELPFSIKHSSRTIRGDPPLPDETEAQQRDQTRLKLLAPYGFFIRIYNFPNFHEMNVVFKEVRQWCVTRRATRKSIEFKSSTFSTRFQGILHALFLLRVQRPRMLVTNNCYVFRVIRIKLKNGWTTVAVKKALIAKPGVIRILLCNNRGFPTC